MINNYDSSIVKSIHKNIMGQKYYYCVDYVKLYIHIQLCSNIAYTMPRVGILINIFFFLKKLTNDSFGLNGKQ